MSWLDQVLTTPLLGLHSEAWFRSDGDLLNALEPLLDEWQAQGIGITLSAKGPAGLAIETTRGTAFEIGLRNVVAKFEYRHVVVQRAGQPPTIQVEPEVAVFSALFDRLLTDTNRLLGLLLEGGRQRRLHRAGILASVRAGRDQVPPGVSAFLAHLGRPWGETPLAVQARITSLLGRSEESWDRCHHTVTAVEPEPDEETDEAPEVELRLDWQRLFRPARTVGAQDLADLLPEWRAAACDYFERFGMGDLSYDAP